MGTSWVARAIRGGKQAIFNDAYGGYLSVLAHEVGYVCNSASFQTGLAENASNTHTRAVL
jgi:hypothetical protein